MRKVPARAYWVARPGEGEIRSETISDPGPDDTLVTAVASGISRGTESLVFRGAVPADQVELMRCPFQAGDFPAPVKYGYAMVGRTEAGGRVFCLHPHQDRFRVPSAALVPVPDDVPDHRAVLAANMETAVNALWDAGPRLGDRIAVVGGGTVGCLAAALAARHPATAVQLVDIDPVRAETAAALGVDFASPDNARGGLDLVIHASGSADGLATSIDLAGFEATVLEISWYGAGTVPVPLGGNFHSGRLTLRSSQVGSVAAARRSRRTHRDRLVLALDLLRDPMFDALLTGESRFEDLPATMARLAADPGGTLCHVVTYDTED